MNSSVTTAAGRGPQRCAPRELTVAGSGGVPSPPWRKLLGQRAGRLRRGDPQLVAKAAAEPLEGPDRPSAIAGRGQPPHQVALGLLGKRIERHLPARVVDRAGVSPSRSASAASRASTPATRSRCSSRRSYTQSSSRPTSSSPRARARALPRGALPRSGARTRQGRSTRASRRRGRPHPGRHAGTARRRARARGAARTGQLRRLVRALSSSTSGQKRAASAERGRACCGQAPASRAARGRACSAAARQRLPSSSIANSPNSRTRSICAQA